MKNQDGKYNVVLLQCTGIFKNNEQFAFLMLAFFQYFARGKLINAHSQHLLQCNWTIGINLKLLSI